MATETITIVIKEDGSRVVKRNIEEIGASATKAGNAIDFMKSALKGIAGFLAIRELQQAADAYTTIQNRVRLYTNTAQELVAVQNELFNISQETRSSLQTNADLYARLAAATKDLGTTQQDVLTLTKQLNQALIISGASATEGSAGLLQLGQALASGALQADEFRSVNENLPKVMEILAKSLGVTRGQLKQMAAEGKLTATVVLDAFKKFGPELQAEFDKLRPTLSQAFVVLNNAFVNFIGGIDQATGISATFAEGLIVLANNFDKVALAAAAVGGAAALGFLVSQLAALGGLFRLLGSVAVGAFTTLGVALRSVVTLFGLLSSAVLLNPLFIAGAAIVGTLVAGFFALGGTVDDVADAFKGWAKWANIAIGVVVGAVGTIVDAWKLLPAAFADIAIQAGNALIEGIFKGVNKVIHLLNELPGVDIGESAIPQFENKFAGAATEVGTIASQNFNEAFEKDFVGGLKERADRLKEFFNKIANPGPSNVDLNVGIKGGSRAGLVPTLTAEELTKFDSLRKKIMPVAAAIKEAQDATTLWDKALAAGKISREEWARGLEEITRAYRDQIDPLGAVNLALKQERDLLMLSTEAREVQARFLELEKSLREAGIKLTDQQAAALKGELTSLQQLNDARDREEKLLQHIRGGAKDYAKDQAALNKLLADGKINAEEFNQEFRRMRITFLDTQTDMSSGIERTFLKLEDTVADSAATAERLLTDAFKSAEDAVVEFAHTGKFEVGDFFKMIGDELLRLGTKQAILAAGSAFGFGSGSGGGGGLDIGGMVSKGIGSLFGGMLGFASGGAFDVNGGMPSLGSGIDNRLVAFKARDGERVTVTPPGQSSQKPVQVNFNISTPDADSFRRSQGQILARTAAALNRANTRNN